MSTEPEQPEAGAVTDQPATPANAPLSSPRPSPAWTPPPPPAPAPAPAAAAGEDRPEIAVGAAFAGGLVLALILKRLAR